MTALPSPAWTAAGIRPGAVLGRYRLEERLGCGGAADVYRGTDLRLRRAVAVKVFRPGADVAQEERFADEAVLLAGLQHPGLVTVYDTGQYESGSYLVMQLVEGGTLHHRISEATMAPRQVAELGAELAQTLAYVHYAGIVHRDVKPSNILLDADGSPCLTDFGISRLVDSTSRTDTGEMIGTAPYLSPEQVMGRTAGPPADVYALGLVLLECVKGVTEYVGAPLEAAIARLHRPLRIPAAVPLALTRVLRAMTATEADDRPDAAQCAQLLQDAAADPQVMSAAALTDADLVAADQQDAAVVPDTAAFGAPVTRLAGDRPAFRGRFAGMLVASVTVVVSAFAVGSALPHQADHADRDTRPAAPSAITHGSVTHSPTPSGSSPAAGPTRTSRSAAASPSNAASGGGDRTGADVRISAADDRHTSPPAVTDGKSGKGRHAKGKAKVWGKKGGLP